METLDRQEELWLKKLKSQLHQWKSNSNDFFLFNKIDKQIPNFGIMLSRVKSGLIIHAIKKSPSILNVVSFLNNKVVVSS